MCSVGDPVTMEALNAPIPSEYAFENVWNRGEMRWNGRVSEMCEAVGSMVVANTLEQGFWHPARLVRAVIDNHPRGRDHVSLVNHAMTVALQMYAGVSSPENFNALADRLEKAGLHSTEIDQPNDYATRRTILPDSCESTARAIHKDISDPVMFIPVCHGGLVVGLQTFLYHQRLSGGGGSLYPVRHSIDKKGDDRPYITRTELRYIAEQSEGKAIVVIDDDAVEGATMGEMIELLQKELPRRQITGRVNHDVRPSWLRELQGRYWENVTSYYANR